jgi:hypothetical protein
MSTVGDSVTSVVMSRGSETSKVTDRSWACQPRGLSVSPGRLKNCHLSITSRPALEPTLPPIQRVLGAPFLGRIAVGP